MEQYLEKCHVSCYTMDDQVIIIIDIPTASIVREDTQYLYSE